MDGSLISYYWIGFIAADGHFANNLTRITMSLSMKDVDHLEKLRQYLGCCEISKDEKYCHLRAMDKKAVQELCRRFGFVSNKTRHPPDISWLSDDALLAFVIGFIDGDGSIRNQNKRRDTLITIKLHRSWVHVLEFFRTSLCRIYNRNISGSKINSQGYACIDLCNNYIQRQLKEFALSNNLPVLMRKWSRIDTSFVSKQEKSYQNRIKINAMLSQGLRQKDICEILGLSSSSVCRAIKRYHLGQSKHV